MQVCIRLCVLGEGVTSRKLSQGGLLLFMTTDGKCERIHQAWWQLPVFSLFRTLMLNVFIAVNKSSIRLHFPPNRFLIDHWPWCLRTDYLWTLICQAPMKSALSYWHRWFGFILFTPGPEREKERGMWALRKSSLCIDKQHRWIRLKPWVSTVLMSTVWDRHLTSFLPPGLARLALPPGSTPGFSVLISLSVNNVTV